MKTTKISTAVATVLTTWIGVNEIASKETEASETYFLNSPEERNRK